MGSPYTEDQKAIIDHHKIDTIRKIRNDQSGWDNKTPKSEEQQALEDAHDLDTYNKIAGEE